MRFTPRGRKPVTTAAAALLTGLALAAFTPTTAHADETLDADLAFNDVVLAPGAEQDFLEVRLRSHSGALDIRTGYELRVDFSGVSEWATLGMQFGNPDCSLTGAVFTCTGSAWIRGEDVVLETFDISTSGSAAPGQEGTIEIQYTLDGYGSLGHESAVILAHPTDLVAGSHRERDIAYGGTFDGEMTVRNDGDTPVDGVTVLVDTAKFTEVVEVPSNCSAPHRRYTYCMFDQVLQPGATYKIEGMPLAVTADAPAPGTGYFAHVWYTDADFRAIPYPADLGEPGTGSPATLVEQTGLRTTEHTDVDYDNNYGGGHVTITGDNPLDLEVADVAVTGAIGDEVPAVVEVTNVGGATFTEGPEGGDVFTLEVGIPDGTTATAVPSSCYTSSGEYGAPGEDLYRCYSRGGIKPGDVLEYAFTLTIDEKVSNAVGGLKLLQWSDGALEPFVDSAAANNSAKLVVNPTDAPGDGTLPVTGVALSWWIGGGAAALVAGVVGVVLMRRRAAVATW